MQVQAVMIRRSGSEDDPNAQVVVEVQDVDGYWHELGREKLASNFSHCWKVLGDKQDTEKEPK